MSNTDKQFAEGFVLQCMRRGVDPVVLTKRAEWGGPVHEQPAWVAEGRQRRKNQPRKQRNYSAIADYMKEYGDPRNDPPDTIDDTPYSGPTPRTWRTGAPDEQMSDVVVDNSPVPDYTPLPEWTTPPGARDADFRERALTELAASRAEQSRNLHGMPSDGLGTTYYPGQQLAVTPKPIDALRTAVKTYKDTGIVDIPGKAEESAKINAMLPGLLGAKKNGTLKPTVKAVAPMVVNKFMPYLNYGN